MENDFKKLFDNWNNVCPLKKFFFVINDKYKGLPAPIIEKSLELDKKPNYSTVDIDTFTAKDLEKIFLSLDALSMQNIIGIIPDEIVPVIEFEALNEVVSYLLKIELLSDYMDSLIVPDFDEKIIFNGLSKIVENQLVTGSYQDGLLDQYFNETPGIKDVLQKKFHALYEESVSEIPNTEENFPDRRFYYILEQACPKKTLSIQTCVLVLMAYYFSSCDIFEEP